MKQNWLALKTSISDKPRIQISIPKKIVPLAVRRNRLRRLLREAVRNEIFFKGLFLFGFRVLSWPGDIKLVDMKSAVKRVMPLEFSK